MSKVDEPDDLDAMIAEEEAAAPGFARRVDEAVARRRLARYLASIRHDRSITQATCARLMRTSQSIVSRLETGADVQVSTLINYCHVLGVRRLPIVAPEVRPHASAKISKVLRGGKRSLARVATR